MPLDTKERIEVVLVAIGLAVLWLAIVSLIPSGSDARPRDALIGYGCGEQLNTMIAAEEDEFPTCQRIEPNPAYQGDK